MLALSALPGLSIETSTSKVVTLSFSTPIGEICVTWPSKTLSLNVSTRDARRLAEPHAADVGLVDLAAHEDLLDVAERHHQRGVGAQIEDRRHRAADLDVARQDRAANRRPDRRVGELFRRRARPRPAPAPRWRAASATLRLADQRAATARRAAGSRPRRARSARRRAPTARSASGRRATARARWRGGRTRRRAPSASIDVLLELRLGALERGARRLQVGAAPRAAVRSS